MKKYYTDKEYRQLIKNMVILCDTRDKTNEHILTEFTECRFADEEMEKEYWKD